MSFPGGVYPGIILGNRPEFSGFSLPGLAVGTDSCYGVYRTGRIAVRVLCFLISTLMHAGVVALGLYLAVQFPVRFAVGDPVYEVALVRLDEEPPPAPPMPKEPPPEVESKEQALPAKAVANAKSQVPSPPKRVKPRPPSPTPAVRPQPQAEAPPVRAAQPPEETAVASGPKRISTGMDPNVGLLKQVDAFKASPPRPEDLPTAVQGDGTVHVAGTHGFATFADTFSLDMCGADTFTPEDYFGHYRVGDRRFVSVIDGRDEHGGFLFYDSETGMFRRLHRVSQMIFTYGPSFSAEEPVAGSVTILPHKDRYDDVNVAKPNQLIWLPEDPPMRYGELVRFEERDVRIESGDIELAGTLTMRPEGYSVPGVVLVFCTGCVPRDKVKGFARALALQGLAVLAYDVRTCGGAPPRGEEGLRLLASDALAAVRFLRAQPGVLAGKVGLWGKDNGAQVAVAAASMGMEADFLVATYSPAGPAAQVASTPAPRAAGVLVPSLWMFTGNRPEAFWDMHLSAVKRGRDMGRDFDVVVMPDLPEAEDGNLERMQPLSLRFGFKAGAWIRRMQGGSGAE